MTPTKTASNLQTSTSQAAAGTTTGSSLNIRGYFGGVVTGLITNGSTGPTVGCDFIVEKSRDNTNWDELSRQTAPTTANLVQPFNVIIPLGIMYIRSKFTGNTAQAVTIQAYFQGANNIG